MLPVVDDEQVGLHHPLRAERLAIGEDAQAGYSRELAFLVVDVEVEAVLPLRMVRHNLGQRQLRLVNEIFIGLADQRFFLSGGPLSAGG